MNMNVKMIPSSTIGCMSLAILATTISLLLSVLTGWQFGQSLAEKLAMAAVGVLAVLGAHLLLALCRPTSIWVRSLASLLWLFCVAYVAYSHASFFLSSQQQSGRARVASINQSVLKAEPKRSLMAILSDQARIKTELAAKSQIDCGDGCFKLKVRVASLSARSNVLEAEADEVRRWQAQHDRQEAFKDTLRDDLVTTQLAKWLGVTISQMGLVTSLLFSFILEGVACLCWYVALQYRDSSVTQMVMPIVTSVMPPLIPKVVDRACDVQPLSELDIKIEELVREVKAGRLSLTVNGVRNYCRCAQKKATELKRMVDAKLNTET